MQRMIFLVFALSFLFTSTTSYLLIKSDLNQLITFPNQPHIATQTNSNSKITIPQAPTAIWIWDKNWNNAKCQPRVSISEYFLTSCTGQITIYATANKKFNISINGNPIILSGNDQSKIFSTVIPQNQLNRCRFPNSFIMTAETDSHQCQNQNYPGLIYALVQNTQNCYECPIGFHYNLIICGCRETQQTGINYTCNPPLIKDPYIDGCFCQKITNCLQNQFFDHSNCKCRCKVNQVCNSDYIFDQKICDCVRNPSQQNQKTLVVGTPSN